MRPSIQLPSVSGVHSKLGLTVVRPSLQPAHKPPALDPQAVSKHVRQISAIFWVFDVRWLDPWPFLLKIGTPFTHAMRNVYILILIFFLRLFCFRVTSPYRTDGQTDGRARPIMRPVGRPHNEVYCQTTKIHGDVKQNTETDENCNGRS